MHLLLLYEFLMSLLYSYAEYRKMVEKLYKPPSAWFHDIIIWFSRRKNMYFIFFLCLSSTVLSVTFTLITFDYHNIVFHKKECVLFCIQLLSLFLIINRLSVTFTLRFDLSEIMAWCERVSLFRNQSVRKWWILIHFKEMFYKPLPGMISSSCYYDS